MLDLIKDMMVHMYVYVMYICINDSMDMYFFLLG